MSMNRAVKKTRRRLNVISYRIRFYELLKNYVVKGRVPFPEIFRKLAKRKSERKDSDAIVYHTLVNLIDGQNEDVFDALIMVLPREEIMLLESSPKEGMSIGFDQVIKLAKSKSAINKAVYISLGLGFLSLASGIPTMFLQLSIQIPEYLNVLPEEHWPEISRFSLFLYRLLIVNFWVVPLMIVALTIFVLFTLYRPTLVVRKKLDAFPPWSIQRSIQSSSFMVSMGTLLNQRVAFPLALERVSANAPDYMAMHLEKMEESMAENIQLDEVIDTGFLPRDRMDYVQDFVDQNSFSDVLKDQGEEIMDALPGKIKAIMLTFIAVMILSVFGINVYVSISGQQVGLAAKSYFETNFRN